MTRVLYLGVAVIVIAVIWAGAGTLSAQQGAGGAVRIDGNAIGGVVTGPSGPEAGVWVIAETTELPTKFARIVVTDDQGRYVVPDLPKAKYKVWVRGYGLVDSPKVDGEPGKTLNLRAVVAPTEAAAAQYYPAIYWYSMLKIPEADQFGGKSNIPANISQSDWLVVVKNRSCVGCHQLGQLSTRTIPASLGQFETGEKAWIRRVQSGQAAPLMLNPLTQVLGGVPFKYFGDWTDRVAKGELPHSKPPRPTGVERNIVVTTWEWGDPKKYLHDLIASDRRYPTVNAYGKLYGSPEYATDDYPILDPKTHAVTTFRAPVRDADTPEALGPGHAAIEKPMAPSPYWGDEKLWDTKANNHNGMFDRKGRVWFAAVVRGPKNPEFCQKGSDHPSAKLFPLERTNRALTFLDPKTMKYTFVDTCFQTHHLQFAYDANETVWTSGGGPVLGWVNTKMFDETGDAAKSQGWTAFVLDTNGNGKRDDYVEPDQPVDPTKDKRVVAAFYGIGVNPVDGTVWGSVLGFPGHVIRLDPGANPPATALAEIFEPPLPGYGPRGMDIDRNGVVWTPLSSGHLASFDRRRCKGPLNGPTATGHHCPEGWMLHSFPGPQLQNVKDSGSAEASYYAWVDQFDTLGLGKNVPIATGNANEALLALVDGKFVELRVPYPMGFYTKWMDGRIDDPAAGWKGKGLWATYSTRAPFHVEGGKGTTSKVLHFQLRPDPLAR
jgi:hypothetical protein